MCNLTVEIRKEEINTKRVAEKTAVTTGYDVRICLQPLVQNTT